MFPSRSLFPVRKEPIPFRTRIGAEPVGFATLLAVTAEPGLWPAREQAKVFLQWLVGYYCEGISSDIMLDEDIKVLADALGDRLTLSCPVQYIGRSASTNEVLVLRYDGVVVASSSSSQWPAGSKSELRFNNLHKAYELASLVLRSRIERQQKKLEEQAPRAFTQEEAALLEDIRAVGGAQYLDLMEGETGGFLHCWSPRKIPLDFAQFVKNCPSYYLDHRGEITHVQALCWPENQHIEEEDTGMAANQACIIDTAEGRLTVDARRIFISALDTQVRAPQELSSYLWKKAQSIKKGPHWFVTALTTGSCVPYDFQLEVEMQVVGPMHTSRGHVCGRLPQSPADKAVALAKLEQLKGKVFSGHCAQDCEALQGLNLELDWKHAFVLAPRTIDCQSDDIPGRGASA